MISEVSSQAIDLARTEEADLLACLRKIGKGMIASGVSVGVVENTLTEIANVYGAECEIVADSAALEPALAETLSSQAKTAADEQEAVGLPAVLLVPAPLRLLLSRYLRRSVPSLRVISHSEVPDSKGIRVSAVLGAR